MKAAVAARGHERSEFGLLFCEAHIFAFYRHSAGSRSLAGLRRAAGRAHPLRRWRRLCYDLRRAARRHIDLCGLPW